MLQKSRYRGRRRLIVGLAVALLLGQGALAAAQTGEVVSVAELLADPIEYSGEEIIVEGELVGDYGFRDDGTMWTQLNDDSYAREAVVDGGLLTGGNVGIGVQMPSALARGLDPVGGYRLEGPLVRLTGTWKYHDPGRGGESYLAVAALEVIEEGRRLEEGPDWAVFTVGALLVGASLVMWWRRRAAMTQR